MSLSKKNAIINMSVSHVSSVGRRSPNLEVMEARGRASSDSLLDKPKANDNETDSDNDVFKSQESAISRKRRGNSLLAPARDKHKSRKKHRAGRCECGPF